MAPVERVLVVGGGPAGLASATTLRKRGITVDVLEINDHVNPLGSGLTMMGPTLRALRSVDEQALETCIARGAGHDRMVMGDAEGHVFQDVTAERTAGADIPAGFGIMRPVLWEILAETARRAGARIELSTTVVSIDQDADGVDVVLSSGARRRYDLVVGADGLHSKVRALVFPDAPEPYYNGQTVWRAVVTRPRTETDYASLWYGPRLKAGYNPVSDAQAYVFCVENALRRPRPPQHEWPALIQEALSDFSGLIGWARGQMTDPARIDCHPPQILLIDGPWFNGRVLLVGDAAHSTTPHLAMGAGIAVEDAVVLAEVIDSEQTVEEALSRYMARRYERARLVVRNSEQLGAWEQDPSVPATEHARLTAESLAALAQPI